jgi:GDP-L-fucose synthase
MNILLTGANGFLGHHLVDKIAYEIGKINQTQNYNGEDPYQLHTPSSAQMNCLNYDELYYYCLYNNITGVIHLAAECGGIGVNQRKPGDFFLNNGLMSLNVLKLAHEYPEIKKTVTLGTVCSYPKHTPVPFKEEDLWNGYPEETNAPYGLAKKNLLVGAQALSQQYGHNIIHLIPVNMYGEHDHFDLENSHVIPAMLRKFHEAKESNDVAVHLWGDGSASREFLYAGDCAEAIWQAFLNYDKPDPVNIGASKETTIRDLAETIKSLVGFKGDIVWDTTKPNGQPRRCLDTTKAKEEFNFEAKTSLEEGLERTYNWYVAAINHPLYNK